MSADSSETGRDGPGGAGEEAVVTLGRAGRRIRFALALDAAQTSHRHIRDALARGMAYEPVTTEIMLRILRPGDTMADGGAHIGYFTLLGAALVGAAGRVFAFEPEPGNLRQLRANIARNGFQNVQVADRALSDAPGQARLSLNRDNDGGHALWDVGRHFANPMSKAAPDSIAVPVTTLDDALKDAPPLRLLKLDVEGAETVALRGAGNAVFARRVPFVIAEINILALHFMGTSELELRRMMTDAGYETFGLFDGAVMAGAPMAVTPLRTDLLKGHEGVFNILFATPEGVRELTG